MGSSGGDGDEALRTLTYLISLSLMGSHTARHYNKYITIITNHSFFNSFYHLILIISDVRIHSDLNKFVWSNGVKSIAKRIRVKLSRKRNDNEDAKEKLYTLVEHVPGPVKGLETKICED